MKHLYYLALFSLLLFSCKKDDPKTTAPRPLLIRETDQFGVVTNYTYDTEERLILIENTGISISFEYSPNLVNSLIAYDNGSGGRDTIFRVFTLTDGYASQILRTYPDGSSNLSKLQRDAQHRIVREDYYNAAQQLLYFFINEYDAEGNQVKTLYYDGSGLLQDTYVREFAGKITNTLYTGKVFWVPDPPYALTKLVLTDAFGEETYRETYSYKLDDQERISESTYVYQSASSPGQTSTFVTRYEYR